MLDKQIKQKIIQKFKTHENDTGSSEVQIAILTEEINQLIGHLKTHRKDNSSRRGLLRKVNERRHLLKYLLRENAESYNNLIVKLKIKKTAATIQAEEALEDEKAVIPTTEIKTA